MISFLAKIFVKDEKNSRGIYGVICGAVGIFFNIFLFIIKFIAGTISGSIAITADAFNNLSDSGSSIITLIGFRLAGQKPDKDHPFGHGRIEYISGVFVSMVIVLMAFELFKSSIDKIINPQPVEFSLLAILILIVSIAVKLYMFYYNRAVGKKINSATIAAAATDSISDCGATTAVLLSMIIGRVFNINLDAYFGLLVAAFIAFSGFKAAKETLGPLLGEPPSDELVDEIKKLVLTHDEIVGMHDMIIHDYGPGRMMISLHAEIPSGRDILEAHDLIDLIEREIAEQFSCDCVIHMDPLAIDDEVQNKIYEKVIAMVRGIDDQLSIHDFRMVSGPTHTNLIFDVVDPYGSGLRDDELKSDIEENIRAMDGNYFAVIKIDKSYVK